MMAKFLKKRDKYKQHFFIEMVNKLSISRQISAKKDLSQKFSDQKVGQPVTKVTFNILSVP